MTMLTLIKKADCKRKHEYAELYRDDSDYRGLRHRLIIVERRMGKADNILDMWDGGLPTLTTRFNRLTGS